MKLYYAPGTCALGIHIILEEIGRPYELGLVDFPNRAQYQPAFVAINPKSKVPVLQRDDGSILTQYIAIASWLALTNPDKALVPADPEGLARSLEIIDYVCATIHMQSFVRFWRPGNVTPNEADHPAIKARGKEILEKGLALMDKKLEGKEYVAGKFSIADAALFYVEFWAAARMKLTLPKNCAAHYERMKNRPAVKRTIEQEGLQQAFA